MNDTDIVKNIQEMFPNMYKANFLSTRISALAPEIKDALILYLDKQVVPTLSESEFTVTRLEKEHGMKVIAALFTLDWIKREPEKALSSLKKGHDVVIPKTN